MHLDREKTEKTRDDIITQYPKYFTMFEGHVFDSINSNRKVEDGEFIVTDYLWRSGSATSRGLVG